MRRTIQTTHQGLDFLLARGFPLMLRAEWQENSDNPCDTGSSISALSEEFPHLDWTSVDPVYPQKKGLYRFTQQGLKERGVEAKKWLKNRPEEVIAVVSHAGFLRVGVSHSRFENADFRIFEFKEGDGGEDGVELVECEETEKNGGGRGVSDKGRYPMMESDNIPRDGKMGEVVEEKPKV